MPAGRRAHVNPKLNLTARRSRPFGDQLRLDAARVGEHRPKHQQKKEKESPHALAGLVGDGA
jgi:hypothetical protein